jgi:hypothetical protein
MDDSSQDQDCSLKDILMAVKSQGDDNTKLRQEISNLRQEMHVVSLSVSSQVKKLKTYSQYAWKYEGNKVQYLLNSEFLEDLAQALWEIDNLKFEHARETISELVEKVKRRNKLIKIADTSEGGWETVRQYESNPVASDSDDESKINKAENKALRKHKFKGKKIPAKSIQSNPPQFAASSFPGKNQPFREPQTWYTSFPVYQNQPGTSGYQRRGQQGGGCFSCGSFQHWRNQCPFNSKSIQQKPKAD